MQQVMGRLDRIAFLAFAVTFLIGFIHPVFLHPSRFYFLKYFPARNMLGADIYVTMEAANLACRCPYSPLAKLLFQAMSLVPWPTMFHLLTLLSLGSLVTVCYAITPRLARFKNPLVVTIIFMALLNSYGLHFELERGQWNLIAISLVFASLLAFKRGRPHLSIALFCLACHLKLYPFIFAPLFLIRPVLGRTNLVHFLKLAAVNLALFFVLGWSVLKQYAFGVVEYANNPEIWRGNHSIASFSELVNTYFFHAPYLYAVLMAFYAILLAGVFLNTVHRRRDFDSKYLFFLLVVGSLIIPSISADYTLPALSLALLYFLLNSRPEMGWRSGLVLFALISIVFLTNYSYVDFVGVFQFLRTNKLPLIFAAAMLVTLMSFCEKDRLDAGPGMAGKTDGFTDRNSSSWRD